jgi:RNA polymerase sigma factor (sigma-70 family)
MADHPNHSTRLQHCLDRLRAGDEAARAELLAFACDRLGRLARKMLRAEPRLRRWEQTDDLRQNAMLRLFRALEGVRPATVRDFFRLAAVQVRRELIDLARHHFGPHGGARHAADAPPGDDPPAALDTTHEPRRLADWTELHEQIAKLPDEEREVFDLLWYHELPQAEAAALLGVNPRTLQRRWRAARRRLSRALHGESPDS